MKKEKQKIIFSLLGGLVLYLASAGLSFAAFRYLAGPSGEILAPVPVDEARSKIDLSAPKTEACPLNGRLFTKAERQVWENRRPLAAMIENHEDSRPQSGLSSADVVYEAVAEGGITRFLAVFYCGASAEDLIIGPVRSARTYFLDWASEYGDYPLYAHVGGANLPGPADALGQISKYGWLAKGNDMNQFSLGFPVFWRDYDRIGHPVATEHTMYSSTDKLWQTAQKRGLGAKDDEGNLWSDAFTPWQIKEEASVGDRGSVVRASFDFWSDYSQYAVTWQYDAAQNTYTRSNGGSPHLDLNTSAPLTAKNVVVQYAKEKGPIDDLKHMLYTTTGTGQALVFQDGQVIKAAWSKKDRTSRTVFEDSKGKEIKFNPGPIWIEIVPTGQDVEY